jgi:hypothetical protein
LIQGGVLVELAGQAKNDEIREQHEAYAVS